VVILKYTGLPSQHNLCHNDGAGAVARLNNHRKVEILELTIHAKKSQGTKHYQPHVKIVTTTHEKFKVLKVLGLDQYGNDIKVNVYLDEKQTVKKIADFAYSHPKHPSKAIDNS
jgi:hypothetical protein